MTCKPFAHLHPGAFRSDLTRWRQLVSVPWLADLIDGLQPAESPAVGWQLWEVGCGTQAAFEGGHLPGARYVDTQQFEMPPFWNKVSDAVLLQLLQSLSIGPHTPVIVAARNSLAAARVAHLLLVAGVQDVRLLDGGVGAWCAAGLPLQQGAPGGMQAAHRPVLPLPPDAWSGGFPAHAELLLDMPQARALQQQAGAALVSIRSRAEFMGETSGYHYIAARGDIPGALWGHAGIDGDVNSMDSFQDAGGCMLPAADIEALWAAAGIHRGLHIAFYCGTGWRASLAFFYAWLMGWEHISVFDGGWLEWSADARSAPQLHSVTSAQREI